MKHRPTAREGAGQTQVSLLRSLQAVSRTQPRSACIKNTHSWALLQTEIQNHWAQDSALEHTPWGFLRSSRLGNC